VFVRAGEAVALVVGIACLVFAGYLAVNGRSYEIFAVGGIALIVVGAVGRQLRKLAVGPSGVSLEQAADAIQQATDPEQPKDLKLTITHGYPMGVAEILAESSHIVQVTAVNTGLRPVGVSSLGIKLTGDKWSPFLRMAPVDGNVKLPGILQPEQFATVYNDYDGLVATLREEGVRITHVVAHLTDGTERVVDAPENFRRLPNNE
jgi:hypothetical protein